MGGQVKPGYAGGCSGSVETWVTRRHQRWDSCCSRPLRPSVRDLCCSSIVRLRWPHPDTTFFSKGEFLQTLGMHHGTGRLYWRGARATDIAQQWTVHICMMFVTSSGRSHYKLKACRFISALTRGGPGGMPRPIEMHAHDPRRYLGDMLAWVHQSLASERELFVGLFGGDGRDVSEAAASVDMPKTSALLDRVFDSICRPVKVDLLP